MTMPPESPIAFFDFASGPLRGTVLSLYGARLLHHGVGYMESISLEAIAAVRVGYERHENRIGWGVALVALAIALFVASGPLARFAAAAAAEVSGAQAIGEILRAALRSLEVFAGLLTVAAFISVAAGVAMAALGWIGTTVLVLTLPGTERTFPVRGRNRMLVDFTELLAERVIQRAR